MIGALLDTHATKKPLMNYILLSEFFGLAYQGKDIVFRFIIQYRSLMDFGP